MRTLHKLLLGASLALRAITLTSDAQAEPSEAECLASAELHWTLAYEVEAAGEAPWPSYADGQYEDAFAACMASTPLTEWQAAGDCESETGWLEWLGDDPQTGYWFAVCGDSEGRPL